MSPGQRYSYRVHSHKFATRKSCITEESEGRAAMATGTVLSFDEAKGFGFITPDDGSAQVFAHCTKIDASGYRSLNKGQKVEYELIHGQKGPEAIHIRPF